ncbi:TPA: hypothetical protein ACS70L_002885 [Providencia alcalifaciens]
MSIDSRELLVVAQKCALFNDEAGYRTSISKSYYAVYHTVCDILENGPTTSHQGVIDYLQGDAQRGSEKYQPTPLKALSFILTNMKGQRKIADYYLNNTMNHQDSQIAIKTAEKALERISEMTKSKIAEL